MQFKKYRKKPVIVQAIKFDYKSWLNNSELYPMVCKAWSEPDKMRRTYLNKPVIKTLEGDHIVTDGDYIIQGIAGEFYPYKSDIFHQTYEEITDSKV